MATPPRLLAALILAAFTLEARAQSVSDESVSAALQQRWDGAAKKTASLVQGKDGKKSSAPLKKTTAPTPRGLVSNIDGLLNQTPSLSSLLTGAGLPTKAEREQLLKWRAEIQAKGELAWLKLNAPAPSAHDSGMLAHINAAFPETRKSPVFFVPFRSGDKTSLFARVLGPADTASGFVREYSGVRAVVVDAGQSPLMKWEVAVHELIHARHVDILASGSAMEALVRAAQGECRTAGLEPWLAMYLDEGWTQWLTLQVLHNLTRAGLDAATREKEEAKTWNQFLALVGAGDKPAPASALEKAGKSLLDDFRGLKPGELGGRLAELPSPEDPTSNLPGIGGVYAKRVVIVAKAAKDEKTLMPLLAWIEAGKPKAFFDRFGWKRVGLMSELAKFLTDMDWLPFGGSADITATIVEPQAALLQDSFDLTKKTDDLGQKAAAHKLSLLLEYTVKDPSRPPAAYTANLSRWKGEYLCQPDRVLDEISRALGGPRKNTHPKHKQP